MIVAPVNKRQYPHGPTQGRIDYLDGDLANGQLYAYNATDGLLEPVNGSFTISLTGSFTGTSPITVPLGGSLNLASQLSMADWMSAAMQWLQSIGVPNGPQIVLSGIPAIQQLIQWLNPQAASTFTQTILRGYIDGLELVWVNGGQSMTVSAGMATDSTRAGYMLLSSSLTKTNVTFVPGANNGGFLDAGTISGSPTTYHWYLISDSTGTTVDIGFSASLTPTLPSGYTRYRHIMSLLYDGIGWVQFVQVDDLVYFFTVQTGTSASITAGTSQLFAAGVPTGTQVIALCNVGLGAAASQVNVTCPDTSDETVVNNANPFRAMLAANGTVVGAGYIACRTNTSGQVRVNTNVNNTVRVSAFAYIHTRGRNA